MRRLHYVVILFKKKANIQRLNFNAMHDISSSNNNNNKPLIDHHINNYKAIQQLY